MNNPTKYRQLVWISALNGNPYQSTDWMRKYNKAELCDILRRDWNG